MKTNTESEFTYRSMQPYVSDKEGVRLMRHMKNQVADTGSNTYHAMRMMMGQRAVYATASPVLLARQTDVVFGQNSVSNSSGSGTFTYPKRTTLFELPSDMSQDHFIVFAYLVMAGWKGHVTDPSDANASKRLKFSCGVSTTNPEIDYNNSENYTNIISNRVVRFIPSATSSTENHAVGLGIIPDIASSWNDFRALLRHWQIGDFAGSGRVMGGLGLEQNQYMVLESDINDTTGKFWGTVDSVSLYGMVYRDEPPTQVVFSKQKYDVAFTPKNISNLELWLSMPLEDATITDGEAVPPASWVDASGQSHTPDAGNAGTLDENSVNGLPSITFDGSNDHYQITDNTVANFDASAKDYAIFVVFQCDTGNTGRLVCRTQGSGGRQFRTEVASNVLQGNFGNTSYVASTSTVTGSSFGIGEFIVNDANNKVLLYWNGAYEDSETTGNATHTNSGPCIGCSLTNVDAPQVFFEGKIAEVIIIGHFVGDTERQKIEGYLAHKYGLTGSLASTHPYKTNAPTENMTFSEHQS